MRTSIVAIAALALCPCYVSSQTRPAQLNVRQRVEHVEAPTREPMVAEHPGGALFVAGYGGTRPTLWKSVNGGAAWTRVDVGTEEQGAIGNSGATWQKSPGPGQREWAPLGTPGAVPRWVEPIAWDSAGHLYSLWTDTTGVLVARSTDRAKSWSTWQVVRLPATFSPYLIARGRGQLAASWFSMSTPTGGDLRWHAAMVDVDEGNGAPRVIQSAPHALDAWRRVPGGDALAPDAGGEYLGMIFLRDGGIGLATPIQNPATQRFGFTWWRLGTR